MGAATLRPPRRIGLLRFATEFFLTQLPWAQEGPARSEDPVERCGYAQWGGGGGRPT